MKAQDQGRTTGRGGELSRRRFLAGTGFSAATFLIAGPRVLGQQGEKPASERLNIAGVGVGGRGFQDMEALQGENIVALCDVDWAHAGRAFNRWPAARRFRDYRKMLDEMPEIDAVMVATPDHMHAPISLEAMRRGKHVYCEKPLTHSVAEAREMAQVAAEMNLATQMGNQGQASEETRLIYEYIRGGAIGPVREVHVWTDRPNRGVHDVYWPQGVDRPGETPPVPDTLDWNLFLGVAPERPFHPAYHPFRWRGWWDFGCGALGDIGCHSLDPVFRALDLGAPLSVQASSTLVNSETFPLGSIVRYEFGARGDMPPVSVTWYDGGLKPPRPVELRAGRQLGVGGTLYVGDEGVMLEHVVLPEERRREIGRPEQLLERSPGHHEEWIRACKGGQPAGANFAWAGPLTEAVLLGNVALRPELREPLLRQKLEWDPKQMAFANLPEANQFLKSDYRQGW